MPVVSVTEDQVLDAAGNYTDVYDVTFTLAGRAGNFTVQVPQAGDAVAAAAAAVAAKTAEIEGIYSA